MTEEQIDKLTLRLTHGVCTIFRWLALQCLILFLIPLNLIFLTPEMFLYIVSYTFVFNVYCGITPKDKRLNFVWKPYAVYLIIAVILSFILLDSFSLFGILFAPLYGLLCFIVVRRYRHFRKTYTTTLAQRIAFNIASTALIIAVVAANRVLSVSHECQGHGSFDTEKNEILQRRNYLASKLITFPQKVLHEMPSGIGEQFQGEWALYSCSMFAVSLYNISRIYPETKTENTHYIDSLISIVLSPELRKYDSKRWKEDVLSTLYSYETSHISYISHLAWMIGEFKAMGGGNKYDKLYAQLCDAMYRRILHSPALNLQTYPNEPIYIPDMLVAIVALKQYSILNHGKYSSTVNTWVVSARKKWCDPETGMLVSFLDVDGNQFSDAPIKGSYSALNCYYLTLIDRRFAQEQYLLLKKNFWKERGLSGMKEYYNASPIFGMDIDAGPVVMGLSPSGTAFSAGAATFFKDNEVRTRILRTAEIAGYTLTWDSKKHYALANIALPGEAIMLAMRTNAPI